MFKLIGRAMQKIIIISPHTLNFFEFLLKIANPREFDVQQISFRPKNILRFNSSIIPFDFTVHVILILIYFPLAISQFSTLFFSSLSNMTQKWPKIKSLIAIYIFIFLYTFAVKIARRKKFKKAELHYVMPRSWFISQYMQ